MMVRGEFKREMQIVDSEAWDHTVNNARVLFEAKELSSLEKPALEDSSSMYSSRKGKVVFQFELKNRSGASCLFNQVIEEVLLIINLLVSLLSFAALCKNGYPADFLRDKCDALL